MMNRTVTFRHHLFQPTKNPIKATFQPCSDSTIKSSLAFNFKSPIPMTPTMDVTVSGEILLSPPIQPLDSSLLIDSFLNNLNPSPLTSPLITTLSSRNTSIQGIENMSSTETNLARQFCPGCENGYANSPMASLMSEYQKERDDDPSTQQCTANLYTKKTLAARDIIYLDKPGNNIALVDDIITELTQVIGELQTFLERTSGLIPERRTFFKVDPRGTFMTILSGTTDLPQLHAAWFGLNKRLGLAQENLNKYEAQYRQPIEASDFIVPTSPISTDPEIYEAMSDLGGEIDSRLRYLYQSVPHLQEGIHSPKKLTDGSSWNDVLSLPENLADLHQSEANFTTRADQMTDKGKGRNYDNDESPPTSPRMLNVGYGTPFRSSSQFFDKPDRQ